MTGGEIAVFVVTCVTALLFLIAIWEAWRTLREAKSTTEALRNVQNSINMQSEAMYVSQLWFKWSSPEIRYSITHGLRLKKAAPEGLWMAIAGDKGREAGDALLEVPRFFDDLVGNLLQLGTIREETALRNFGDKAADYWDLFEPLIRFLQEKYGLPEYQYASFEEFSKKGKTTQ